MSRRREFQRNPHLENLLTELNRLLSSAEKNAVKDLLKPRYPLVLVQGVARSGTTPLMQWLAGSGHFSYPSNLLSRFYQAPYIGAKIQQMLFDPRYNFRDELSGFSEKIEFDSSLGKTRGLLSPNEFWYFWRRFFEFADIPYLDRAGEKRAKKNIFLAELAALESVFDKPVAMKGMIINWNIPFVSRMFDRILFIHIKRHPLYNIQSLIRARKKFNGTETAWYSFKPREYPELKDLPAESQVAGQIFYTNRAIEEGLAKIDTSRWLNIGYEDFCADPGRLFRRIMEKFAEQGYKVSWKYTGRRSFQSTNKIRLSRKKTDRIIKAYRDFSGEELAP